MAETSGTTRPARTRTTAAKAAPAKAAATPAKKAAPAAAAPDGTPTGKLNLTFKHVSDTKNFSKFEVVTGSGCVGAIYVPLGTTEVKAVAYGPTS